jgi:NDP-sugar pyrophosphorylase family protein
LSGDGLTTLSAVSTTSTPTSTTGEHRELAPTLVVLAAGMGSRYGGLKQVDGMGPGGEAILEYSIHDALEAGFGDVVLIIRKDIEEAFRDAIGRRLEARADIRYAYQEFDSGIHWTTDLPQRSKPWGTAHAIYAAAPQIHGPFSVVNADDFYGAAGYRAVVDFLRADHPSNVHCLPGYSLLRTLSDHGTVSRGVCEVDDVGMLTKIVERTAVGWKDDRLVDSGSDSEIDIPTDSFVSMNFWGFQPSILAEFEERFRSFFDANRANPKAELFLPMLVGQLVAEERVGVQLLEIDSPWFGVTYPEDKPSVQAALLALTEQGEYTNPLWGA